MFVFCRWPFSLSYILQTRSNYFSNCVFSPLLSSFFRTGFVHVPYYTQILARPLELQYNHFFANPLTVRLGERLCIDL